MSRKVTFGGDAEARTGFTDNKLITSKYTLVTFVPYNLFEQFQKQANVYFLLMSILMAVPEFYPLFLGTIKAWSTAMMLFLMMLVSAIVAALDDYARHKSDRAINSQKAEVLARTNRQRSWERLQVGEVVLVRNDREIPADILILAHSGAENCFVSTANLDGETNLKPKSTVQVLADKFGIDAAAAEAEERMHMAHAKVMGCSGGEIEAEAPSNQIYVFNGKVELGGATASVGMDNLLLRGTTLRNTDWCIGLVLYTGKDTRMVMNSRKVPSKQSNLELVINRAMWVIIAVQVALALISDVIFYQQKDNFDTLEYLYPDGRPNQFRAPTIVAFFLTFFVLYSNLMPVSLYATMELCNAAHARFINMDKKMRDETRDLNAKANGTNLCNELGQISHVFSDKTGTLTQNVMELVVVGVGSACYGKKPDTAELPNSSSSGTSSGTDGHARNEASFWDGVASWEKLRTDHPDCELLECLAVAHTVMKNRAGKLEAENPDEEALVRQVGELGWSLQRRSNAEMTILHPGKGEVTYKILAINAFNSTRKRMSIVVERGQQNILFIKGADNVMLELARKKGDHTLQQLSKFSNEGLRTLAVGQKILTPGETTGWLERYKRARQDIEARAEKLDRLAAEIESGFEIIGVTGIEDKLQLRVPDVIVNLRKAGIRLWVLTGDKLETAKSIGFSTKVLTPDMEIVEIQEAEAADGVKLEVCLQRVRDSAKEKDAAIIVTGDALTKLLEPLNKEFLEVGLLCSVVIACRVSPLQKGEVVRHVRNLPQAGRKAITLSIGDGANDVPMIQEAHVGIGIFGYEGQQAVNAADFAIAQFRFLEDLLLVHGRWNYRRMSKLILYTFWRNAVQVLLMFYYTFYSGFSGTALFEDNLRITFNPLLSIPILATGVFDQDVRRTTIMKVPKLYQSGRDGLDLNPTTISFSIISAFTHSVILWLYIHISYADLDALGNGDYFSFTTMAYTLLIVSMTWRVAFITTTWNLYTYLSLAAALLMYLFYLVFYNFAAVLAKKFMYQVPLSVLGRFTLWLCVLGAPATAFMVDSAVWYVFHRGFDIGGLLGHPALGVNKQIESAAKDEEPAQSFSGTSCAQWASMDALWQQELPSKQSILAKNVLFMIVAAGAGILMLITGVADASQARAVECMAARYAGDAPEKASCVWTALFGSQHEHFEGCTRLEEAGGANGTTYSRTFKERFSGELHVFYELYPFYQNHAVYMRDDELRLDTVFSDTFTITLDGDPLEPTLEIAFRTDRTMFPEIQTDEELEWNRPAAMPLLRKRVGTLKRTIPAGATLRVEISDSYRIANSEKRILLTTLGEFGGSDPSLAWLFIVAGGCVTFFAMIVFAWESIAKNRPAEDDGKGSSSQGSSSHQEDRTPLINNLL